MTTNPAPKRGYKLRWTLIVLAALALGAVLDLYAPVRADLRNFDPRAVARLDNAMWRAYHERKPIPLFLDLAQLLRTQFHFPFLRSYRGAFHAARAALVFKRGQGRGDYEEALPDLRAYFGDIHGLSRTEFDVRHAAELELEWWIVHRERGLEDQDSLAHTVAAAAAALYRVDPATLETYGRKRAEAMAIRDYESSHGGVTDTDWAKIGGLLDDSWRVLWEAVNPQEPRAPEPARNTTAPS